MLKGKWKALLVLNYFSAVVWVMMLLVYVFMMWQANRGGTEVKSNVVSIALGGMILILFNIFFLYVLKAYYPAVRLKRFVKFLYVTGLIYVGTLALLFVSLTFFSAFEIFSNPGVKTDVFSLATLLFSFIFAIINSLLFIWHFQLIDVLSRNNEEAVKSVLASIGVDQNNSLE